MIIIISFVEDHLINYFKSINNLDTIIMIFKILSDIIRYEICDIVALYNYFEQILNLVVHKINSFNIIVNIYDVLLNLILETMNPLTSKINMVLIHFRDHSINALKNFNELSLAIEIYRKLIWILFEHENDTIKIINEYKIIANDFKIKHFLGDSIIVYENLFNFVCQFHSTDGFIEQDLINFVFSIWMKTIIKEYCEEKKFHSASRLHRKMIHFLEYYRRNIHVKYNLNDFISKILENYDGIAMIYQLLEKNFNQTINIYQEEIQFLIQYDVQTVQNQINRIFSKCQQYAIDHKDHAIDIYSKLIILIEQNRLYYLSDIFNVYQEYLQLEHHMRNLEQQQYLPMINRTSSRIFDLKQRINNYKEKAKYYLNENQEEKGIKVYKEELLQFLLENHSRDNEQIITCYRQMASLYYEENKQNAQQALKYYQNIIDIYEKERDVFYTDHIFKLNQNICRSYVKTLFQSYQFIIMILNTFNNQTLTEIYRQKQIDTYYKHKDLLHFVVNPITNVIVIEI